MTANSIRMNVYVLVKEFARNILTGNVPKKPIVPDVMGYWIMFAL